MSTTVITADEVRVGDRVIITKSNGTRFAMLVERFLSTTGDVAVVMGRQLRISDPMVGFQARKVQALTARTQIERFEVTA